jgi:hypothetical protein
MEGPTSLYFASTKLCALAPIAGEFHPFEGMEISLPVPGDDDYETQKDKALARKLNPNKDPILPGIPASEFRVTKPDPIASDLCLIKVKMGNEHATESGTQSGQRSAILAKDGKFYRLKGCGLKDEGWGIAKNEMMGTEEIRGCHYYFTAVVELYYSGKIDAGLKKRGYECGNIPRGIVVYSPEADYKTLGIEDKKLGYEKCCAVFETLGDKRLATHLLQGLR